MGSLGAQTLLIIEPLGQGEGNTQAPSCSGNTGTLGLQRGRGLRRPVFGAALPHPSLPLGFQRTWKERAE